MIALDSNILIYAHRQGAPEHQRALAVIAEAAASTGGWGFSVYSVGELYRVVTHELATGGPSRPADVRHYLETLEAAGGRVLNPDPGFATRLLKTAEDLDLTGRRIYDLQIALTVREAGAREIWTNDRGFVSVPGLRVVNPF